MVAAFLPSSVGELQDAEAIALLQKMQRCVVPVSCQQGKTAVATAYASYIPESSLAALKSVPMLLLPGFDSSLLEFRRLLPFLAEHQEVWAIDRYGSGFTEYVPTLAVNAQTIRQHLLSVLETWLRQPVMLVGASLGGAVALDFALHHPNWVQSLVLIDSVGFSSSFPVGPFLPQPLIELGADWLFWRKHAALAAASVLPMVHSTLVDALRCSLLHQQLPGWKESITSWTQSGGYANLSERLTQITQSALILWGRADDVLGTADAIRFEQTLAKSQLVWIEDAGHVPHFDQPQVVANHLLAFARQTGS